MISKTILHEFSVVRWITLIIVLTAPTSYLHAGIFSSRAGKTFETKGKAVIYRDGKFTAGIEKSDIPIPTFIDVSQNVQFAYLTHDAETKWTKCRVPLGTV